MKIFKLFGKKNNVNTFNRNPKVKIGVAFGGGGTRGFAHLGAIKAFEQHGINFDYITGTSVGSLIGAMYASGKTYKEMYEIAKSIKVKDIKSSPVFFMPSKTDGIQEIIDENITEKTIEKLKTPFAAIAVDLKSTKEIVFTKGELKKVVGGSCSVPGLFQPVQYDKYLLSDGGLQDTIPAGIAKMLGCDYVVGIDVNPTRVYGTSSTKVIDVLACSIRILMKANALKGYINSDVIIKPNMKRFKSSKTDNFQEMIEEGYKATIDEIEEIIKLFNKKPLKKKIKSKFYDENIEIL